jgi:hypothetical protein
MRIVEMTRKFVPTLLLAALTVACQATPSPECPQPEVAQPLAESPENHAKAVRELFQLMQMPELMESTIDTLLAAHLQANPALVPYAETMQEFLHEHLSWESLEEEYVTLYTAAFTQREIEDMVAFYRTPTGQKAVEKLPELMQQGAEIGQVRMRRHIGDLQEKLKARIQELEQGPPETPPEG